MESVAGGKPNHSRPHSCFNDARSDGVHGRRGEEADGKADVLLRSLCEELHAGQGFADAHDCLQLSHRDRHCRRTMLLATGHLSCLHGNVCITSIAPLPSLLRIWQGATGLAASLDHMWCQN